MGRPKRTEKESYDVMVKAYDEVCRQQEKGPKLRIRAATMFTAYIGMRVVITHNFATELGVSYGAMGRIERLHFPKGAQINRASPVC
jgi:hypothetical protein